MDERKRQIKMAFAQWLTSKKTDNQFGFIAGAEWADKHHKFTCEEVIKILDVYETYRNLPWNESVGNILKIMNDEHNESGSTCHK